jgi:hypothetical protein
VARQILNTACLANADILFRHRLQFDVQTRPERTEERSRQTTTLASARPESNYVQHASRF